MTAQQNRTGTNLPTSVVGVINIFKGRLQVDPCNKKDRNVHYELAGGGISVRPGDVVVGERQASGGLKISRILGRRYSPGIESMISIFEHGLSEEFSQAVHKEASIMTVPALEGREDLRNIPLVTIDGEDAKDFDDAIFAEKTADGGHHLIVAIADVSYYVRPDSELDKQAYINGNSTYLDDRVLPMLPEELSNDLCSLRPNEDRACMAFHLWIDKDGNLKQQKVVRGLMRSKARLTYTQVQTAKDGYPDAMTAPLMNAVINPVYDAYKILRQAREARSALELGSNEFKTVFDANGEIKGIQKRDMPESCKVIEEFMITANVAAARALREKNAPCVFRTHDELPAKAELREYLATFGLTLPEEPKIADFNRLIKETSTKPYGEAVADAVKRAMAKAIYSTDNIGHFGLALEEYAHFTSPIRRYADLLVHRALVTAYNLGPGGLPASQKAQLSEMAEHISATEVNSMKAERDTQGRLSAKFLSASIGKTFQGVITAVKDFGAFVRLDGTGAEGMLPLSQLPADYYDFNETQRTLVGRQTGQTFRAGDHITVRLREADNLSGRISLMGMNDNNPAPRRTWSQKQNNFRRKKFYK